MSNVTHLLSLPEELWVHIFSFHFNLVHLPKVALICREWRRVVNDPEVWKNVHCRTFCISFQWLGSEPSFWRDHVIAVHKAVAVFWKDKPKTSPNYVSFGTSLYRQTFLNESLGTFNQGALFQGDPAVLIARQCTRANIFLKLRKFGEAVRAIQEALDTQPEHEKCLTIRGNICLEQGQFQEARASFLAANVSGRNIDAMLGLMAVAKELNEEGEFNRLKEEMRHGDRLNSSILLAKFYALFSPRDCRDYAHEALEEAKKAKAPTDLAAYLAAFGQEALTREAFEKLAQEGTSFDINHANSNFNSLEITQSYYEQSIEENPYNVKVLLSYVGLLEYAIQVRIKFDRYFTEDKVIKLKTTIKAKLAHILLVEAPPAIRFLAGRNLHSLGEFQESKNILAEKQLRSSINSLEGFILLIETMIQLEKYREAEKLCHDAFNKYPDRKITLLLCEAIAKGNKDLNKYKEAEKLLNAEVAKSPEDIDFLLEVAKIQELQENYVEAEKNYRKAREMIPEIKANLSERKTLWAQEQDRKRRKDLHAAHLGITRCLHLQGNLERSRDYCIAAVSDYDTYHAVEMAEELLMYHRTERPSALLLLKLGNNYSYRSRKLSPGSPTDRDLKVRFDKCREKCYQEAIALAPSFPDPYLKLAEIYYDAQEPLKAMALLDRVLKFDSENIACIELLLTIILDESLEERYSEGIRLANAAIKKFQATNEKEDDPVRDSSLLSQIYISLFKLHHRSHSLFQAQEAFVGYFIYETGLSLKSVDGGKIQQHYSNLENYTWFDAEIFSLLIEQDLAFQEQVCKAVLEKNSKNFKFRCLMGNLLMQKKENHLAALQWELAYECAREPRLGKEILVFLSNLYKSMGEPEKAKAADQKLTLNLKNAN